MIPQEVSPRERGLWVGQAIVGELASSGPTIRICKFGWRRPAEDLLSTAGPAPGTRAVTLVEWRRNASWEDTRNARPIADTWAAT